MPSSYSSASSKIETLPSATTPAESVKGINDLESIEMFFHLGNRLLISLEKSLVVAGFFLLMVLVLYPILHRFDLVARMLESMAGEKGSIWNVALTQSDWAMELSRFVLLWITMLGAALAISQHKHISIDVATNFLQNREKALFSLISGFIGLIFCAFLLRTGLDYVLKEHTSQIKTTTMQIPVWWVKSILPLGFSLFCFHFLVGILEDLRGIVTEDYAYLGQYLPQSESNLTSPNAADSDTGHPAIGDSVTDASPGFQPDSSPENTHLQEGVEDQK